MRSTTKIIKVDVKAFVYGLCLNVFSSGQRTKESAINNI